MKKIVSFMLVFLMIFSLVATVYAMSDSEITTEDGELEFYDATEISQSSVDDADDEQIAEVLETPRSREPVTALFNDFSLMSSEDSLSVFSTVTVTAVNEIGHPLSGIEFLLSYSSDGYVWSNYDTSVTTGSDGKAVFNDLMAGDYRIVEVTKDPQYSEPVYKPDDSFVVSGDEDQSISVTVVNPYAPKTIPTFDIDKVIFLSDEYWADFTGNANASHAITSNAHYDDYGEDGFWFVWDGKQKDTGYAIFSEKFFEKYESITLIVKCSNVYKQVTITEPGVYFIDKISDKNIDWVAFTLKEKASDDIDDPTRRDSEACFESIGVRKVITGDVPEKAAQFEFMLKTQNAPMPEGASKEKVIAREGEGNASFGLIRYTEEGTYIYTITELDTGEPGCIYDRSAYILIIVVADNDGVLVVESKTLTKDGAPADEIVFINSYIQIVPMSELLSEIKSYPRTGDDRNNTFYYAMVFATALVIAALLIDNKKRCARHQKNK